MQHIIYTPSSTIPSATKTTATETIEGTTMIIFDLVKEQHEWHKLQYRCHDLYKKRKH